MWWTSIDAAASAGFSGFRTVADLRATKLRDVPAVRGVYLVYRASLATPTYLAASTGGHFKGKNPTVDPTILSAKWVPSTAIIYVGKAGAEGGSANLRTRLKSYLQFGAGKPVGHWGGRYVWQLSDAESLVLCWKPTPLDEPLIVEQRLLDEFASVFERLPFANCRR